MNQLHSPKKRVAIWLACTLLALSMLTFSIVTFTQMPSAFVGVYSFVIGILIPSALIAGVYAAVMNQNADAAALVRIGTVVFAMFFGVEAFRAFGRGQYLACCIPTACLMLILALAWLMRREAALVKKS